MAKLYKVRKKCMICGSVFYPKYAGSLYCEECKNRKKPVTPKLAKKAAQKKKPFKAAPKKTKVAAKRPSLKKSSKSTVKKQKKSSRK
ncbi:MAG: hypothetical protein ABIJ34_06270 [archaeon]